MKVRRFDDFLWVFIHLAQKPPVHPGWSVFHSDLSHWTGIALITDNHLMSGDCGPVCCFDPVLNDLLLANWRTDMSADALQSLEKAVSVVYEADCGPVSLPANLPNSNSASIELGLGRSVNLKALFPQSRSRPLRYAAPFFFDCALGSALLWLALESPFSIRFFPAALKDSVLMIGLALLAILATGRYIYEMLCSYSFAYGIEDFRMVVRRGALLATEGSLPLSPSAEIYIRQTLLDKLFGIYEVHVMMGAESSRLWGRIEGLGYREAMGLKKFLSGCFAKFTFVAPEGQSLSLDVSGNRRAHNR